MSHRMPVAFALAVAGMTFTRTARADDSPEPGDTKTVNAVTISLRVGNTGKDSTSETYTAPPGWYVESHQVKVRSVFGESGFSVSTVPADWEAVDKKQFEKRYDRLIDLTVKAGKKDLAAKFRDERNTFVNQYSSASRSHHHLRVKAKAEGEGIFKGGGAVKITVQASLMYVGDEKLAKRLDEEIEKLK